MNSRGEDTVCTAPRGMVRLVYVDPRGPERTVYSDHSSMDAAKQSFRSMLYAQAACMEMYSDTGVDRTEVLLH